MLKKIKNILLLHEGRNNPVTSAEIAEELGIEEDDTHSQTRALIFECAKKYHLPVAASNKGYFLISNNEEYNEYINNLDSRITGIQERKRIITENFNGEK